MNLSRREVLSSGAALVAAIHVPALVASEQRIKAGPPLLRRIRLGTRTDLRIMEDFYCGKLGLPKEEGGRSDLSVRIGASILIFKRENADGPKPFTHLAFNIPQNTIRSGLDWLADRAKVIPAWGDLADPGFPKEVVHFRHWNAHSLFFWDPAGNLLELIARHDLANDSSARFTSKLLLNVSELGLAVRDPSATARFLHKEAGIPAYPRGTEPTFAMGDENGLLLCLQRGQMWNGSPDRKIYWETFPTEVDIRGNGQGSLSVGDYPFTIKFSS